MPRPQGRRACQRGLNRNLLPAHYEHPGIPPLEYHHNEQAASQTSETLQECAQPWLKKSTSTKTTLRSSSTPGRKRAISPTERSTTCSRVTSPPPTISTTFLPPSTPRALMSSLATSSPATVKNTSRRLAKSPKT